MSTEQTKIQARSFGPIAANSQRFVTNLHKFLYRLSGGTIGGRMFGVPVLLLTTIGRKTGKQRTTPLMYLTDNDRVVLVASNGGAVRHPLWWQNLLANPRAEVEIGRTRQRMTARIATPEERTTLWPRLVALYPSYADYQKRTPREIPVVILQREEIMLRDNGISAM